MKLSKRTYQIAVNNVSNLSILDNISLADILSTSPDNDSELHYSLQENIDEVLDLKPNQSMTFLCNRDDINSHGIILRIK